MNKKSSILITLFLLFGLVRCTEAPTAVEEIPEPGQEAVSGYESYTDMAASELSVSKQKSTLAVAPSVEELAGGVSFYSNRDDFRKAVPDWFAMGTEDFEGSNFSPPSIGSCSGPINQATGGFGCYPARREIIKVFSLDDQLNFSGIAVLTPGAFGVGSTYAGPNAFADNADIRFTSGTRAVGFDLFDPFGGSIYRVTAYGSSGAIASVTSGVGFVGFISHHRINRILITPVTSFAPELIDNLTFQHP